MSKRQRTSKPVEVTVEPEPVDAAAEPVDHELEFLRDHTVMTFGKYKGKLLYDVLKFDAKYAQWIYRQEYIKKFENIYAVLDHHFSNMH